MFPLMYAYCRSIFLHFQKFIILLIISDLNEVGSKTFFSNFAKFYFFSGFIEIELSWNIKFEACNVLI